jgi:hypothetical protein
MLLQTNSYIVPAEKRVEHQRLLKRFRHVMIKLGCDSFDTFEQVGPNWAGNETTGRFVQIMRFRDHQHQRAVQAGERSDPTAQALIAEFCDLINLPYQQQQGLFAIGFYRSVAGTSGPGQHAPQAAAPVEDPSYEEATAETPAEPEAAVEPEPELAPESTEEAVGEVDDLRNEPQPDAGNNDPADLAEFDIEALAEDEIGGFDEKPGDPEKRRHT